MDEKEFEYNGTLLRAVPMKELKEVCDECYFYNNGCGYAYFYDLRPSCLDIKREDETNVIFIEVKEWRKLN